MVKYIIAVMMITLPLWGEDRSSAVDYGVKLYEEALYDVAITQFSSFIERNPASIFTPKAELYLAKCYEEQKQFDEMEKHLKQILLDFPETEEALQSLNRLSQYYKDKDPKKSSRYLLQAKEFFSDSNQLPKMIFEAIELLYSNKLFKEASIEISYLKRRFPRNPFALKGRTIEADILLDKGEFLKGDNIFKTIINIADDTQKNEIYYLYGIFLKKAGSYSQARENFSKVVDSKIKNNPFYYPAAIEFSRLAMKDKIYNGVYNLLTKVTDIPEEYKGDYLFMLGEVEFKRGNYNNSFQNYLQSYEINPQEDILIKCGEALAKNGEVEKSGDFLKSHIDKGEGGTDLIYYAAQLYMESGRFFKAVEMFRTLFENYPDFADIERVMFLIGKSYYEAKDYDSAFDHLENFVKRYPFSKFSDNGTFLLAESGLKLGEYEKFYYYKALKYYETIIDRYGASQFYSLSENRAEYLKDKVIKSSNFSEKIARFAIDVTSKLEKLKFAFYDLKDYPLAIKLAKGVETSDEVTYILHSSYLKSGLKNINDIQSSVDKLSPLLQKNMDRSRKVDLFFTLIEALSSIYSGEELNQFKSEYFINAINSGLDDNDGTILRSYCKELFYNGNDPQRAIKFCESYALKYPNSKFSNEINYYIGSVYEKNGNMDLGTPIFEKIIRSNPTGRYSYYAIEKLINSPLEIVKLKEYIDLLNRGFYYTELSERSNQILGDRYLALEKYRSAQNIYQKIFDRYQREKNFGNEYIYTCLKLSSIYEKSGDIKSEKYLKEGYAVVEEKATKLEILNKLSQFYKKSGNLASLKYTLSEISRVSEGKGAYSSSVVLGDIEFNSKNYTKSLKIYKKAFKDIEGSKDIDLQFKIIVNTFRVDKISEAINLFKKIGGDDKERFTPQYLLELGNSYLRKKNYDKALDSFEDLTDDYEKSEFYPEGLYGIALVYYNIGKKEKAFTIWEDIVKRFPSSPIFVETNYYLGAIYLNKELMENSIQALQNVVDYRGEHRLKKYAYNQLIDLYKNLSFNDAALKRLREYIELYPESDDIFNKRIEIGTILQKNGEYEKALDHLQRLRAEAIGEDLLASQFYIAETYMLKGNYRRAISEFLKVKYTMVNNTPYDWKITAVYKAAQCYEKLSQFEKAIGLYEEILERYDLSTKYGKQAKKSIEKIKNLIE